MRDKIYKNINNDKKEIYTGEDFSHCKFPEEDPKGFRIVIETFLEKY